MTILEDELSEIGLHVGDIIIQRKTGYIGMLVEKFQNAPKGLLGRDIMGDLWFWRIKWLKNIDRDVILDFKLFLNPVLEEEGLKMSIFLGNIEHYKNGSFEEVNNEF